MFNTAIAVEIFYCSENESVSRVKLVLHQPNVPVSVVQEVFDNMKPRATFAAKRYELQFILCRKHALSKRIHLKGRKISFSGTFGG